MFAWLLIQPDCMHMHNNCASVSVQLPTWGFLRAGSRLGFMPEMLSRLRRLSRGFATRVSHLTHKTQTRACSQARFKKASDDWKYHKPLWNFYSKIDERRYFSTREYCLWYYSFRTNTTTETPTKTTVLQLSDHHLFETTKNTWGGKDNKNWQGERKWWTSLKLTFPRLLILPRLDKAKSEIQYPLTVWVH